VTEEVVFATPFGSLLHFKKENSPEQRGCCLWRRLSGHFATLLRGTVKTLLQDHDVYITDWQSARDSAQRRQVRARRLYEHTHHIFSTSSGRARTWWRSASLRCRRWRGGDHVGGQSPARPATLTLMAGPIDTRIQPTKSNDFAKSKPLKWFEENLINYVPIQCKARSGRSIPASCSSPPSCR